MTTQTAIDPRIGTQLAGRYQIEDRIAVGGMATVYRGTDELLGRRVAVKIMHPALAADVGFVTRFRAEAKNAARLNHPNLAMVHDTGQTDDAVFIVLELVEGTSLRDLLDRFGHIDADAARRTLAGISEALDHAHERGIVHRDIKPENILLTESGAVKVVDFGVAHALGDAHLTTGAFGTAAYISPEQLRHTEVDGRADIYALGIVAFEMFTGRVPFHGDTPQAVAAARLRSAVPAAGVSRSVDAAIAKATATEPSDRFDSAGDFVHALDAQGQEAFRATGAIDAPMAFPTEAIDVSRMSRRALRKQDKAEMQPRERRIRKTRRGRRVAIAMVLILSAFGGTAAALQPWMAKVPTLDGLDAAAVGAVLERSGLALDARNEVFHDSAAPGIVVGADPASGSRLRRGGKVSVLVSKGPELFSIPALAGTTLDEATQVLERGSLARGAVIEEFSREIESGKVLSQDPAPDAPKARRGALVSLVVSKGPDYVNVPSVGGQSPAKAKETVQAAGLVYAGLEDFSDTVAAGAIISVDPKEGGQAIRGDKVRVTFSKGPRSFEMPSLVGMSRTGAKEKLASLGLVVGKESSVPGSEKPSGTITGQSPGRGTQVRKGAKVDLYYAA